MTENEGPNGKPVRRPPARVHNSEKDSRILTLLTGQVKEHYDRVLDEKLPPALQQLVQELDEKLATIRRKRR